MQLQLLESTVHCPYCGEPQTLLIDPSETEQQYVEDCQICCAPMVVDATVQDDIPIVNVSQENA